MLYRDLGEEPSRQREQEVERTWGGSELGCQRSSWDVTGQN